jgi:L,D-transpeptidase-like protein
LSRIAALVAVCVAGCGASAARSPLPARTRQLVVGTTSGWDRHDVTLRRYQREASGPWRPVGDPWPAVAGRAGLAWGRGLHDGNDRASGAPEKREGDGRAPAGAFAIVAAYGYDAAPPPGTRLPYAALDGGWLCVDDPGSTRYNRVLDAAGVATPDWSSAERMRRDDELYRWVLFIAHNAAPPRAGAGSCIFFHVWGGPDGATSGCTAMERSRLEALLGWLDPAAHPVYVLLPDESYRALAAAWGLPR